MQHCSPALAPTILLACALGCAGRNGAEPLGHFDPVRFVAIGDTGEGNEAQYEVGRVMADVCEAQGCDFVLLLGDNIYDNGVSSVDDPQWDEKFELPYADVDLTFHAVLGNHDYSNNSSERAAYQVAYTEVSDKWSMPYNFYSFTEQNIDFIAFDSQAMHLPSLIEEMNAEQDAWLADQMARDDLSEWVIAMGHHPYLSNGQHGNAGNYDRLPSSVEFSGQALKETFDREVCGKADLYLCGHDHDRQFHETTCQGTRFVISGAGSQLRDFRDDAEQQLAWGEDAVEGLAWFEIHDRDLSVQFWNRDGELEYEGGWSKE